MKKPNFPKWAKQKIKLIREQLERGESGSAYETAAIVAKELAKRYERLGSQEKARGLYAKSGETYEQIQNYDMAARMYHKAGISSKVKNLREEIEKRRRSWLENLETAAVFLFITLGIFFMSSKFTGYSILNLNQVSSSSLGAMFILFAVLIIFAKRFITLSK